jgi:hypothetical protein
MKSLPKLACGLMTSVMIFGMPYLSQADTGTAKSTSGQGKIADKDFGRLSADGVSAFNDIHMARVAIFDGRTNMAAKLVADAMNSLEKARTDNTVFMKAESELHTSSQSGAEPQGRQSTGSAPISWIPIDCEVTLDEDYQAPPEQAAAVVNANKSLEKGDGEKALEAIRLAAVDVNYTLAAAPVEQSLADVTQANQLISNHDYYGASQALRKAEAGIRYDEIDDVANVRGANKAAGGKGK